MQCEHYNQLKKCHHYNFQTFKYIVVYARSTKDAVFLKHGKQKQKQRDSSERTSVSSKTNFGRYTYSERFIILVELYYVS